MLYIYIFYKRDRSGLVIVHKAPSFLWGGCRTKENYYALVDWPFLNLLLVFSFSLLISPSSLDFSFILILFLDFQNLKIIGSLEHMLPHDSSCYPRAHLNFLNNLFCCFILDSTGIVNCSTQGFLCMHFFVCANK